ncbi:helix-turn-helix domain-containing protein [Mucilaginibacter limnophilus]|uniref:Helix-turn-helix domain-containing protein n=1 Tax=Mucilaginibacter limnophilus TaxID=1932778 RepID=A0A3S2VAS0_9SPHI|nr:helix-turn-helix domain-containing protein [Mucilaginibacter limnophilus]RVU03009.1 helix-turn-helix domain-containing protein [Mucilaginibacter limnophilus]
MQIIAADLDIPKYNIEPDPVTGNRIFRVIKADCRIIHMNVDFLRPHRKDYYFFALVRQGNSRHWIDMVPYTLKPDTLYFTVPHQIHLKEEAEPMVGTIIAFTEEFLTLDKSGSLKNMPIIQNPQNGHELSLSEDDIIFLEDIIGKITTEYQLRKNWQGGMLMAYMNVLIIYLSRLYNKQFVADDRLPGRMLLKKYLSKIEDNYTKMHEVIAYADALNISAGHLSDVVKEQSGRPAIAHIHERLMLEAKRLLFHTEKSSKEIAFELGFEDASYFNRFFKRLCGTTPAGYRIQSREMYH